MSSIGILLPGSIAHACPIPIVVDWCQCNKRNLECPAVYCISVWLQVGAIAWQAQIFARCLWVWGQRYARRHVCHLQGKDMQVPPCPDMPLDQLKCHVTIGFGETRQGVVNIASNWSAFRAKQWRSEVELFHFIQERGSMGYSGIRQDVSSARVGSVKTLCRPGRKDLSTVCLVSFV